MAKPDDRVPLKALNKMLGTVQRRKEKAKADLERHTAREAELLAAVEAEHAAVKADLADAEAAMKGGK